MCSFHVGQASYEHSGWAPRKRRSQLKDFLHAALDHFALLSAQANYWSLPYLRDENGAGDLAQCLRVLAALL